MMTNILEYLEKTVSWLPQKRAIWDASGEISFSRLHADARAVGYCLFRRGIRREPVAVFMARSSQAAAAMLGAVYAGCWFVPLDGDLSAAQLGQILKKTRPRVILCDDSTFPVLEDTPFSGCRLKYARAAEEPAPEAALDAIRSRQVDTDPVCILFPGGQAEGILTPHRALIETTETMGELLRCSSNTVFGSHASFCTDVWLRELMCVLKYGGSACLLPRRSFLYPGKLMEYLNRQQINTLLWNSANLAAVAGSSAMNRTVPKFVQTIAFYGAPLTARQLSVWLCSLPGAKFFGLYGPAEALGMCCCTPVARKDLQDTGKLLGRALPNMGIVLLDENDAEALPGTVGEICVRGSRLSPGYFRDPELTARSFIQNPLNPDTPERLFRTGDLGRFNYRGELEFLGRKKDSIRCRIDLTELQTAGKSAS